MTTLNERQFEFTSALAKLFPFILSLGYQFTLGDAWALKGEGRKHSKDSFHYDRLAIDINLFKHGKYLTKTSDHIAIGAYWTGLGGTWGGKWDDGNHYSWGEY